MESNYGCKEGWVVGSIFKKAEGGIDWPEFALMGLSWAGINYEQSHLTSGAVN